MKQRGFNLIELMVVLAVIGVLTMAAIPAYNGYVRNTRHADAKAALVTLASAMERNHSTNDTYVGVGQNGDGTGKPKTSIYTIPAGIADYYNIEITNVDANTYLLTATPVGAQVGDKCGELTLSDTGATTAATGGCW